MAKYSADTIPICTRCDAKDEVKICLKCHINYCKHFASYTDLRFCGNCIADVQLKETILEKVVEHERPDGTVTFSRKYQARRLVLQGNDWLFASHLIADMSDADIEASVEYHRANVDLMLQERESRKLERYRKLAGIKISINKRESQEQREKREARELGRSKLKEKDPAAMILAALTALAKAGMKPEDIIKVMSRGKK